MMKKTVSYDSNRARKLIAQIIEAEDINVSISYMNDAIGDSVIVAAGSKTEIRVLCEVFNMVF